MTRAEDTAMNADDGQTVNARTTEGIESAPLPTARKLRQRQSLLIQSWRFVRFNLRMMRIIRSGNH